MPNDDPPPPLSPGVVEFLSELANAYERSLDPIVDASFAGIAEVAFAHGRMSPYDVRDAIIADSTGHHLHVCLDVLGEQLRGTVTVEMLSADGAVLRTESIEVNLPNREPRPQRRRPRPLGLVSLMFPVHAGVAWGPVRSARLSWVPTR